VILPRARAAAAAALSAPVLLLSGCGSSAPAAAPRAPGPTGDAAAQRGLARALLTSAEMPLGFERQDGSGAASAIGCAGIDRLYLATGTAARATVSFAHVISDAFVNETVSTAADAGAASAGVEAFRRAATDCRTFAGAQNMSYRVTALAFPRLGDGSAALRVSGGVRESRPVDLVAVRVGPTVVVIANANSGRVDTDLTRTVVARAVEKVRRAG